MSDEREIKEKTIDHPLEDILNIESGTTIVEYKETPLLVLTEHEEYDNKDSEIEEQFQEVYTKAMDAFEDQSEEAALVEGKFKARNAEVASTFLNTALNAAKEKSIMKQSKDKLEVTKEKLQKSGTTNNNLIVTDRNEILKLFQQQDKQDNKDTTE